MLQSLRRHWLLSSIIAVILIAGITVITLRMRAPKVHVEPDLPAKPEAPPDLEKLRDTYAAGLDALQRDDGADAVKHLSSFTFGSRAVEEYRLYYLANGYQIAGNAPQARVTLARLWRRTPRMMYAQDAAFNLATLYTSLGDFAHSGDVYAALAHREEAQPAVTATARWRAAISRLQSGDPSGALYNARVILIDAPASDEAKDAAALARALSGIAETMPLPLTHSERLDRAVALRDGEKAEDALAELTALERDAPELRSQLVLQRGLTLQALRKYEDSSKALEPLTGGAFKYAIPALRAGARNYAVLAASINPEVIKTVKERKKTGTVKVRTGKGKKKRTVTKPKYQTVFRQVKLIDLAKKKKKDEYERLASERLKDLLSLPLDDDVRIETLNALIERASAKNQDPYVKELVPQLIKLDPSSDPALQHFWDKGWAAYARGDLNGAKEHFRFITDTYTHANVKRQSEYWYARTVERLGQKEEARAIYQRLASAPYEDLYAQNAVARGAKRVEPRADPLESKRPDWREIAETQMPKELELAYELTALSSMKEAFNEVRGNVRRENNRMANALLADIYQAAGNRLMMYAALKKAWPQLATIEQDAVPLYFFKMYYPVKYSEEIEKYAKENRLDPNLVRGLILQESYYNPKAKSRVGATGLMQIMPATAKDHAQRVGVSASNLSNPKVNIAIGTYHLRMLVDMFRGNVTLAIASYNAGQGNVLKWKRAAPSKPTDEFVEAIPFQETRNYVKRVTMLKSTYARLTP